MIAVVLLATLVALFAGFRSLLVPLKAVLLNLLSVAAAFGALVLVFQDGHGVSLLGLAGPVDGVFPIVPALVFCSVFGLSMDYEVFLVARVREERRAGRSEQRRDRGRRRPHRARDHERRGGDDRGVRLVHARRLRADEDAGLRAGGRGAARRHADPAR